MTGRPTVFQVIGPSGSGKTTLIEGLLPRLRARGLRVGAVKHAHDGFELDHEGKDSWRYAQAGAEAVAIVGPRRAAWFVSAPTQVAVENVIQRLAGCADVWLIEGFHRQPLGPRLQVELRAPTRLACTDGVCRLGVQPQALTEAEWLQVVEFVMRRAAPCLARSRPH